MALLAAVKGGEKLVLTVDSQGIHMRFVGLTDQKVTLDQKNVLGISFFVQTLEQFAEDAKTFPKMAPTGHLGLRNFLGGKTSLNQFSY